MATMLPLVRAQLEAYLDGKITVGKLEGWVVGYIQPVISSGDKRALELLNEIDSTLVERGEDLIDEGEFVATMTALRLRFALTRRPDVSRA